MSIENIENFALVYCSLSCVISLLLLSIIGRLTKRAGTSIWGIIGSVGLGAMLSGKGISAIIEQVLGGSGIGDLLGGLGGDDEPPPRRRR